jgi:hypothetical protein
VIKDLHLDFYIDDDLSLLRHVAKSSHKTKFFWLTPQTSAKKLPENIFAISELSEIFKRN